MNTDVLVMIKRNAILEIVSIFKNNRGGFLKKVCPTNRLVGQNCFREKSTKITLKIYKNLTKS